MAKYGGADVVVKFDNATGTLQDMSQYVLEMGDINIEAVLEDSHTFGDSWAEVLFAKLRKGSDISLRGFYDDTATTGPDVIFNDVGNGATTGGGSRTLEVTYGSTKKSTVETFIRSYKRTGKAGGLTRYEVVLALTGAVAEA